MRIVSLQENNIKLRKGTSFQITPQGYAKSKFTRYDGTTILGRKITDIQADLSLADPAISVRHAQITFHPSKGYSLIDLGSSGGTYVSLSKRLILTSGMMIQLASSDVFVVKNVRLDFTPSGLYTNYFKIKQPNTDTIPEESISSIKNTQNEVKFDEENEEIKTNPIIEIEFVLKGQHKGQSYRYTRQQVVTFGRSQENTIQFTNPYISSNHCKLSYESEIG